ncbi:uncharacterized protein LOC132280847 [Cornus florida]|uniref:uncharacterized protein LOC132280847 n=1 Tax=Cornus florida TaxID=4283 RepID=UPI0028976B52|nr:uncharacterized protein LOC132280847 [Cornus florida]
MFPATAGHLAETGLESPLQTSPTAAFELPGYGYGGPSGRHSKGGVIKPTVVCKEKGPCTGKKLTCPAKCFSSYNRYGKNFGSGDNGGGCTMDCKNKCVAYC